MVFRESFYQVKDLVEERLHDFGIASADADTMGWTTMLTISQNTRVTIDVPLVLIYSDFIISGTLETSTYSRIANKTVKLKVGDTIVDTTTTNVNGEYSFTQTPVSTGNHSFQVIFEGTDIYTASQSSVVNRTVEKETTVMNLDAVSTQHYGDTLITGGQLLDDDGQYVANASVVYKLDGTTISTLTTDAQGRFSITRTIDSLSTKRMSFEFSDTDNYTGTSAYVDVDVYQPTLKISSDKNILSYNNQDECTLTAQIVEEDNISNNIPLSGVKVEFEKQLKTVYIAGLTNQSETNRTQNIGSKYTFNFSHINDAVEIVIGEPLASAPTTSNKYITITYDKSTRNGRLSIGSDFNKFILSITNHILSVTCNESANTITLSYGQNNDVISLSDYGLNLSDIDYTNLYEYTFDSSNDYVIVTPYYYKTGYTNQQGNCSVIYNSLGIGDVIITAKSTINSTSASTYTVQDCLQYDSTSHIIRVDRSKFVVIGVVQYNSGDMYLSAICSTSSPPDNWGISVYKELWNNQPPSGHTGYRLDGFQSAIGWGIETNGTFDGSNRTNGSLSSNTEYLFEIYIQGNNLRGVITQVSNNNVVFDQTITITQNITNYYLGLNIYNGGSMSYRNLKIKPL